MRGIRSPFICSPPVGGGDLNNENFLRSYADYRFRASNLIVYELFYERKILDPVGIRLFGELGKVGIHPGDLGFADLKSSVGVSVTVRLGGAPVLSSVVRGAAVKACKSTRRGTPTTSVASPPASAASFSTSDRARAGASAALGSPEPHGWSGLSRCRRARSTSDESSRCTYDTARRVLGHDVALT